MHFGGEREKNINKKKTSKKRTKFKELPSPLSYFYGHNGHSPHEVFTRDVNNTAGAAAEPHLQLPFVTVAKDSKESEQQPHHITDT